MRRFVFYFLDVLFGLAVIAPLHAACTPAGTTGEDTAVCTGTINGNQQFYGGSDHVTLQNAAGNSVYWLDISPKGNHVTDGNDTFFAYNSSFRWVFGLGGDDRFEVYDSNFSNLYGDTNPNWVDQRGDDTILIEDSVSNGWILGGNDNDTITIRSSRVSFVAAGYSNTFSDLPGYLDYTPYDGNDTIVLDNVDSGEPNYYYPTKPGTVEGGKGDDIIRFRHGGQAYNVFGGYGNDRIVVEDDMLFHACTFTDDRNSTVACGIYGDMPYPSEANASTIARHGDDTISIHAGDLRGIMVDGGHGSDRVTFFSGVQLTDTNISGGDDRSPVDGFVDVLTFYGWTGDINGSQLPNWETIILENASVLTVTDTHLSTGAEPGVDGGTHLPYGMVIRQNAVWKIPHDFDLDGNLKNSATIDIQTDGGQAGTTLRLQHDYHGNNGVIKLDTVLNDASPSLSDRVYIEGDTEGNTRLHIDNAGGTGGQTPTGDNVGILVVEVHGDSNGTFALDVPLETSKYRYRLVKGSNGNWYLQSEPKIHSFFLRKSLTGNADEDDSKSISLGDTLTYTVVLENNGTETLHRVVLTDLRTTPSRRICPSVAPGETCVLNGTTSVIQTDVHAGEIVNTATATVDTVPPRTVSVKLKTSIPCWCRDLVSDGAGFQYGWAVLTSLLILSMVSAAGKRSLKT